MVLSLSIDLSHLNPLFITSKCAPLPGPPISSPSLPPSDIAVHKTDPSLLTLPTLAQCALIRTSKHHGSESNYKQEARNNTSTRPHSSTAWLSRQHQSVHYSVTAQYDTNSCGYAGAPRDVILCDRHDTDRPTVIILTPNTPVRTSERHAAHHSGWPIPRRKTNRIRPGLSKETYRCVRSLGPGGSARSSAAQTHWPRYNVVLRYRVYSLTNHLAITDKINSVLRDSDNGNRTWTLSITRD